MEKVRDRMERTRQMRTGGAPVRVPKRRHPVVLAEAVNVCPECGSTKDHVFKTVHYTADVTRRLHECRDCGVVVERLTG